MRNVILFSFTIRQVLQSCGTKNCHLIDLQLKIPYSDTLDFDC